MFVLVSGEEKGLLGSRTSCRTRPSPSSSMVANINMDMVGRNAPGHGRGHRPGLLPRADRAGRGGRHRSSASWSRRTCGPRSSCSSGRTTSASRRGSPAIFFTTGLHEQYHQPGDEAHLIDTDKLARIARLLFLLGHELASGRSVPQWTPEGLAEVRRAEQLSGGIGRQVGRGVVAVFLPRSVMHDRGSTRRGPRTAASGSNRPARRAAPGARRLAGQRRRAHRRRCGAGRAFPPGRHRRALLERRHRSGPPRLVLERLRTGPFRRCRHATRAAPRDPGSRRRTAAIPPSRAAGETPPRRPHAAACARPTSSRRRTEHGLSLRYSPSMRNGSARQRPRQRDPLHCAPG
jgi:hypothetical protein